VCSFVFDSAIQAFFPPRLGLWRFGMCSMTPLSSRRHNHTVLIRLFGFFPEPCRVEVWLGHVPFRKPAPKMSAVRAY